MSILPTDRCCRHQVPTLNQRIGHLDRSNQGDSRNLRRTDTPEHRSFSASADVSDAPNDSTQIHFGGPDRSRPEPNFEPPEKGRAGGRRRTVLRCGGVLRLAAVSHSPRRPPAVTSFLPPPSSE